MFILFVIAIVFSFVIALVFSVDFAIKSASESLEDSLIYKYCYTKKKRIEHEWRTNLNKYTQEDIRSSFRTYYRQYSYSQMPHTTFEEFIQYYTVNPKAWYVDDKYEMSVYRYNEKQDPIFLLFYPFEEYWKFYEWYADLKEENTKNAEAKKQRELEQKQTKEKIALLELVQKDIDALKAQSERELATAREMTEEVKKNLEERVGD